MRLRTSFGRRPVAWRLVAGLSAAALLATLVSVNVLADSYKPFGLTVPATISAGANRGVVLTVTNQNSPQTLGSVEIGLATPGFSFLNSGGNYGTVADAYSTATVGYDSATGMVVVQNLNLPTDKSATVTLYGVQAPGCTALKWSVQAQQANQWSSGNNANYMTLNTSNPPLVSQPAETCALQFSTQPTDAAENQQITGTPLIPTAAPVTVQVVNAATGDAIPAQTNVTLSLNIGQLDYGYSTAALAHAGPVSTNTSGAASFPGLSVNNPGRFTLTASASNTSIASANSSQFRIWDTGATCTSAGCTVPLTSGSDEGFTVSSTSTAGALGASLNVVPNFNCSATQFGGVPALPGTSAVLFTAPGSNASGNKTATLFIPDSTLKADVSKTPPPPDGTDPAINSLLETHYMPCMSAPHEFTVAWTPATGGGQAAKDSAMTTAMNDGQQWYRGLLPDCQDVANVVPCVQSRSYGNGGLTITVILSANDPMLF